MRATASILIVATSCTVVYCAAAATDTGPAHGAPRGAAITAVSTVPAATMAFLVAAAPAVATGGPLGLRVVATDMKRLGSASTLKAISPSVRREVSIDTPTSRVVALVEPTGLGIESRSSRVTLREYARPSGALVRERVVKDDAVNVFDAAWSSDGRALAFCEGNMVSVVGWTGSAQVLYTGPGGPYPGACAHLAWLAGMTTLRFVQLEHATDTSLANPTEITLTLSPIPTLDTGAPR